MKKNILKITLIIAVGSFLMVGCSSNESSHEHNHGEEGHSHSHDGEEESNTAYYCPMKCEGDKTYSEKGTCASCGMDLVVKE